MLKFSKFVLLAAMTVSAVAMADVSPSELLNNGRTDEAIRSLQKSDSAESHNLLCRAYLGVGDIDKAVRNCERAIEMNPNIAEYQLWLGRAYGEKAQNVGPFSAFSYARKTVAAFERALQLNPADAAIRRDLAEYYAEAPGIVGGGKDKARKLADDIAGSDPTNAAWIRSMVAIEDKNSGEAERQLKAMIAASGDSARAWVELARFYKIQQRWNDFDNAIQHVLSAKKSSGSDLFDAGELLVKANRNLPLAVDTLRKYLAGRTDETGPAFRAHYLVGQSFEKQGKVAEAQNEYRSALALASSYRPAQDALRKIGG